jgi:Leucine-rich repeat (LRR) protein
VVAVSGPEGEALVSFDDLYLWSGAWTKAGSLGLDFVSVGGPQDTRALRAKLAEEPRGLAVRLAGPLLTQLASSPERAGIRSLTIPKEAGVREFSPLAMMPQLESLLIEFDETASNLEALGALHELRLLSLTGTFRPTDVSFLAGLTELHWLRLGSIEVHDFGPLTALEDLVGLDLYFARGNFRSLPPERLAELRGLRLGGRISQADVAHVLGACMELRSLRLDICRNITDLSFLAGRAHLADLHVRGCDQIADISPLQGLTGLETLRLSCKPGLHDLSPLASLSGLRELDICGCARVTDLSPLYGFTELRSVSLPPGTTNTSFAKIVVGNPALESIAVLNSPSFGDLSPVAGLSGLKILGASGCPRLKSLLPLKDVGTLESLELGFSRQVADLRPIAGLRQLKSLSLMQCVGISNLSPLRDLRNLEHLNLWHCFAVSDLSPLRDLTGLKDVNLRGTFVRDLSPLAAAIRSGAHVEVEPHLEPQLRQLRGGRQPQQGRPSAGVQPSRRAIPRRR